MRDVQEERELNQKERQKHRRFRASVWKFLGRLAGYFSPPLVDLPTYESSLKPVSPERLRREGKAHAASTSPEEELDDEDEEEEADENEKDKAGSTSNNESDNEDEDDDAGSD